MANQTTFSRKGRGDAGLRLRLRTRLEGKRGGISHQHLLLDDCCGELRQHLSENGAGCAMSHFILYENAMNSHMKVEEEVYFPALHGLNPAANSEIEERLREHQDLRLAITFVERAIARSDTAGAIEALDQLALEARGHEELEEELIERLTI